MSTGLPLPLVWKEFVPCPRCGQTGYCIRIVDPNRDYYTWCDDCVKGYKRSSRWVWRTLMNLAESRIHRLQSRARAWDRLAERSLLGVYIDIDWDSP